jgi:ribosomal protein S27AE
MQTAPGPGMTLFEPRTPYSDSITRPNCPRCGTRMMLARLSPVPNKPGHDKRTFECPKCGNEVSEVVKFK